MKRFIPLSFRNPELYRTAASRQEAFATGSRRYTGKPCGRCGNTLKDTKNGCVHCAQHPSPRDLRAIEARYRHIN